VAVSEAVLVLLLARLGAMVTGLGALAFLFLFLLFTQVPLMIVKKEPIQRRGT
jgi:hypothetical protein